MLCGGSKAFLSSCDIVRVTPDTDIHTLIGDIIVAPSHLTLVKCNTLLRFAQVHAGIFGLHITQGSVVELSNVSVIKNKGEGVVVNGVGSLVTCR